MSYMPICSNHKPVQHRDAKPPWCESCGLTATYASPASTLDTEHNRLAIQIKTTQSLRCAKSDLTVGILTNFLNSLNGDGSERVRINVSNADRPGEISMVSVDIETSQNVT